MLIFDVVGPITTKWCRQIVYSALAPDDNSSVPLGVF